MKELRSSEGFTLIDDNKRKIVGYALVFNKESRNLGGFTEVILPNALDGVLEKSNVLALLNHDESRGVLARSRYGKGSLKLTVDDIGLRYEFEAPNTPLGDELIEGIKRGDITTSSFAFSTQPRNDEFETWSDYRADGTRLRTIKRFVEIFDVSAVYREAYEDTTVALRSLGELSAIENTENREQEKKEEVTDNDTPTVETPDNTDVETPIDFKDVADMSKLELQDELCICERKLEDTPTDKRYQDRLAVLNTEIEKRINPKREIKKMAKFNLIKTINDIVNNRSIDETAQSVLDAGKAEMRKAGLAYAGQIQLPVEERTDPTEIVAGVAGHGAEVVATDKLNILEPLRAKMVLAQAGATYLSGLVGNISIPRYDKTTVGWEGEVDTASNGKGAFSSVEFSPKRLTAYIDVSKQFLNQDSVGAEEMLRRDIVAALADKLESTILGNEAGSNVKPKGLFNGVTASTINYNTLVEMEQTLEEANVGGDYKIIVSPAVKAHLKTTTISGTKSDLRMISENNEANGYPVLCTSNSKGMLMFNPADLVIAQFGCLDLVIDPYSVATKGCVRIVINAYFDCKPRHTESVVAKVLATE